MVFTDVNPMENNKVLGDVSVFWSWSKRDGKMPKKIQFWYSGIREVPGGETVYWVNTVSPVIELAQNVKVVPQGDFEKAPLCYLHELSKSSNRNFLLASDQSKLHVSMDYLIDLYPDLGEFSRSTPPVPICSL